MRDDHQIVMSRMAGAVNTGVVQKIERQTSRHKAGSGPAGKSRNGAKGQRNTKSTLATTNRARPIRLLPQVAHDRARALIGSMRLRFAPTRSRRRARSLGPSSALKRRMCAGMSELAARPD
jgi:hypothetical protein